MPILGLLAGGVAKKLAGKAAKWVGRRVAGSGAATGSAAGRAAGAIARNLPALGGGAAGGVIIRNLAPQGGGASGGGIMDRLGRIDLNPFDGDGINPFGSRRRRYRRTNYLNQRALKKAVRRVQGFEKIVREAFTVSKGSLQIKKRRS